MRLIQWNCQGAFRKKYNRILNYTPDILTISECENPGKFKIGEAAPTSFIWYGDSDTKGIGIFSFSDYKLELLDCYNPEFRYILPVNDERLNELLDSGQSRFYNQVAWARQYLSWEGLLDTSQHGIWALSPKGESTILSEEDARGIFLKWVDIHRKTRAGDNVKVVPEDQEVNTPIDDPSTNNSDLLKILQSLTPSGFEKICQRLLRESGFENVVVTGQSHDGGIDGYGILEMNPFVSFKVLFQCKRYKGTVSRAQVGDFRNAMIGRAEKGIIMTTGNFSYDAIKEANRDGAPQVELVDGEKLVEMFKKVELGLKPRIIYEVDLPFFEPYLQKNN